MARQNKAYRELKREIEADISMKKRGARKQFKKDLKSAFFYLERDRKSLVELCLIQRAHDRLKQYVEKIKSDSKKKDNVDYLLERIGLVEYEFDGPDVDSSFIIPEHFYHHITPKGHDFYSKFFGKGK